MRIAIVVPYIRGIWGGNRIHLELSSYLSTIHEVNNFSYKVYDKIITEYRKKLNSNFEYVRLNTADGFEFPYSLKYMYGGLVDFALYKMLRKSNKTKPLDTIILISSTEGWWLGFLIKKFWKGKKPKVYLFQTDPPLGVEINFYEKGRSGTIIRSIINRTFIYFQKYRIKFFDTIFGLSNWTNDIMHNYYGTTPVGKAGGVDPIFMSPINVKHRFSNGYIVVPTVALDEERKRMIKKLHGDGIDIELFGPVSIDGMSSHGFLNDEEMINLIGNANALLFLFDYEGFGLVPLESLSIGTPVITEDKQGPGGELRDNKFVHFIKNYDDLKKECRKKLSTKLSFDERMEIHASVGEYSFQRFAERVDIVIREKL